MNKYLPEQAAFAEQEWRNHAADDFRWLCAVPSSTVSATAEVIRANPSWRDLAFLARYAEGALTADERTALWNQYLSVKENSLRYTPIADWKPGLRHRIDHGSWSDEEKERLEAGWRQIERVDTPRAADIRKTLQPIFVREFGVKLASDGGGVWTAGLSISGLPVVVVFDFGGFSRGFRHHLRLPLKTENRLRALVSYESALGFNDPPWDLLRTDVLAEQLRAAVEVIKRTLAWLDSIDWCSKS